MTGAIQTGVRAAAPEQAPDNPPPRRNARQEQQRRETREALLTSAAAVFSERGYLDTSVEHVLARAGVSRAAFYAHFDGKLALVCEIARDFVPKWRPVFDQLAALPEPSVDQLEAWARTHMAFHRANQEICGLLTQVASLEDRLYELIAEQRDALIAHLAGRFAAFRRATEEPAVRLRARLLLSQLDEACFLLVRGRIPDPDEHGPRHIAEQLREFLQSA
jgi:AcrR family transcriptional regulator